MNNALATNTNPMNDFQEKLKEKIRSDIANLLPEEAINSLVQEAVKNYFFEPRVLKVDVGYKYESREEPSWFVEEVTKTAKPILKNEVAKFVEANKEQIETAIKQFLSDQNLLLIAMNYIQSQFTGNLYSALQELRNLGKL